VQRLGRLKKRTKTATILIFSRRDAEDLISYNGVAEVSNIQGCYAISNV